MATTKRKGIAFHYKAIGPAESSQHHWLLRGSLLERSYKVLIREAKQGDRKFREIVAKPPKTPEIVGREKISWAIALERQHLLIPAAMLAGMAIECYFKSLAVSNGKAPTGHDLAKLAQRVGFITTTEEGLLLDELTEMNQLGRYHRTSKGNANFHFSSSRIDSLLRTVTDYVRKAITP